MAATKDLTAVTLQLEVKNGVDKNDPPKFKDISYDNLDTKATANQLTKTPRADHGRPDPAGRPGCSVRLPHGHLLVPVGTHGRETGEPDPEHRTAAHGSEDGIEKKRAAKKIAARFFSIVKKDSRPALQAYQMSDLRLTCAKQIGPAARLDKSEF